MLEDGMALARHRSMCRSRHDARLPPERRTDLPPAAERAVPAGRDDDAERTDGKRLPLARRPDGMPVASRRTAIMPDLPRKAPSLSDPGSLFRAGRHPRPRSRRGSAGNGSSHGGSRRRSARATSASAGGVSLVSRAARHATATIPGLPRSRRGCPGTAPSPFRRADDAPRSARRAARRVHGAMAALGGIAGARPRWPRPARRRAAAEQAGFVGRRFVGTGRGSSDPARSPAQSGSSPSRRWRNRRSGSCRARPRARS